MTQIGKLINKAILDGKVTQAEVEGLINLAKSNGIVSKAEKTELTKLLTTKGDKFDAKAHATLASFLGLAVQPPPPKADVKPPAEVNKPVEVKKPVDLPDPAVLEKHKDTVKWAQVPGGQLYVDGISADDVIQGAIGDCFFVAALSAVAHADPKIIEKAIKDNGDGTYTVRFYKKNFAGRMVAENVTVDADLPGGASPRYAKSRNTKELWVAVAEKAYAQWKGGYEAINNGGFATEVMTAFTGQPAFYYPNKGSLDDLYDLIETATEMNTPVAANTYGKDSDVNYKNTGIYAWHMYSVLGASTDKDVKYVHLRNPWGSSEPGSDGKNDGIFKMKIEDFAKLFQGINVN